MVDLVDVANAMRMYRRKFGRFPNLLFPKTYNEKVVVAKLTWRSPLLPLLVDKVAIKELVATEFGADLVTPNLYVGDWLPPREQRNWPMPYVIKPSHSSGANIFVRSEAERDWDDIEARLRRSLSHDYGKRLGEWPNSKVPRKVLVEPFIGSGTQTPLEFKFFVGSGRVAWVHATRDRYGDAHAAVFDANWNRLPLRSGNSRTLEGVQRPADYQRMAAVSEAFGRRLPQCRIDFYEVDGKARFGEVTLYSASGLAPITPPEYDRVLGDLITVGRPAKKW